MLTGRLSDALKCIQVAVPQTEIEAEEEIVVEGRSRAEEDAISERFPHQTVFASGPAMARFTVGRAVNVSPPRQGSDETDESP
jgi:hypothetical protein